MRTYVAVGFSFMVNSLTFVCFACSSFGLRRGTTAYSARHMFWKPNQVARNSWCLRTIASTEVSLQFLLNAPNFWVALVRFAVQNVCSINSLQEIGSFQTWWFLHLFKHVIDLQNPGFSILKWGMFESVNVVAAWISGHRCQLSGHPYPDVFRSQITVFHFRGNLTWRIRNSVPFIYHLT